MAQTTNEVHILMRGSDYTVFPHITLLKKNNNNGDNIEFHNHTDSDVTILFPDGVFDPTDTTTGNTFSGGAHKLLAKTNTLHDHVKTKKVKGTADERLYQYSVYIHKTGQFTHSPDEEAGVCP